MIHIISVITNNTKLVPYEKLDRGQVIIQGDTCPLPPLAPATVTGLPWRENFHRVGIGFELSWIPVSFKVRCSSNQVHFQCNLSYKSELYWIYMMIHIFILSSGSTVSLVCIVASFVFPVKPEYL